MKKFLSVLFVLVLSLGQALADDTVFVDLSNQLADQASLAHDAATAPDDTCACERPPMFRNWQLRKTMKDIREIALELRDRAAKGKARTMLGRLKVKRLVANMKTANFLVQNDAALGLDAFLPAWETVRTTLGQIVAEMCCGNEG